MKFVKTTILSLTLTFPWHSQGLINKESHNVKQKDPPSSIKKTDKPGTWKPYYERTVGKPPHYTLQKAVSLTRTDANKFAIDLGCGSGRATLWLLEKGWHVLAIDKDEIPFEFFNDKMKKKQQEQILKIHISMFEDLNLIPYPRVDLIHAGLSLPFCNPKNFHDFWEKVVAQLKPGGIFVGQFFGKKHSWLLTKTGITFHTKEEVLSLLDSFSIKYFSEEEEEEENRQDNQDPIHWHVFHIVARKKVECE